MGLSRETLVNYLAQQPGEKQRDTIERYGDAERAKEGVERGDNASDDLVLAVAERGKAIYAENRVKEADRKRGEQPNVEALQAFLNPDAKVHGEPIVDDSIQPKPKPQGTDYLAENYARAAGGNPGKNLIFRNERPSGNQPDNRAKVQGEAITDTGA